MGCCSKAPYSRAHQVSPGPTRALPPRACKPALQGSLAHAFLRQFATSRTGSKHFACMFRVLQRCPSYLCLAPLETPSSPPLTSLVTASPGQPSASLVFSTAVRTPAHLATTVYTPVSLARIARGHFSASQRWVREGGRDGVAGGKVRA